MGLAIVGLGGFMDFFALSHRFFWLTNDFTVHYEKLMMCSCCWIRTISNLENLKLFSRLGHKENHPVKGNEAKRQLSGPHRTPRLAFQELKTLQESQVFETLHSQKSSKSPKISKNIQNHQKSACLWCSRHSIAWTLHRLLRASASDLVEAMELTFWMLGIRPIKSIYELFGI